MRSIQRPAAVTCHLSALAALGLAGLVCYWPVSGAELLYWDTQTYVVDNTAIHEISAGSLWWMLTQTYHANWHPLTWLSHAFDIQLFGFEPAGHHWVNVAWHVACAWLLYFYAQLLLPGLLPARFEVRGFKLYGVSFFASLLFAVHPQHAESVAWVAERKDLLCAFFYLLCLFCYHHFVARPDPARFALVLGSAAAAIMSKPMAVSLPVVLILLDWLLYRRIPLLFWREPGWPRAAAEKVPFVLLALISVYLTLRGQTSSGAVGSLESISILQRLTVSVVNWFEYLVSTVIPVGLSPYYPFESDIRWPRFLLCLGGLTGLLVVAERLRRRGQPWAMLALTYYSVTLLPVIGIVQIGTIMAADRYTYLPTLPLYLLAAVLIFHLLRLEVDTPQALRRSLPRLLAILLLPLLLGFGTHQYSRVWRSDVALWEFVREKHPQDIYAAINLAEAYYREQRYRDALPIYRRAYHNRELISPQRRTNIFINRYFDTAYRLGFYQEAELAIFTAMQEQRLWFMPRAQIFYNAALINLELSKFDTALQLIEMATNHGGDAEQLRRLRQRVEQTMNNPP